MPNEKRVSEAVIRRLPKYYRKLQELKGQGMERVSSSELARLMGLNASQIRQDFNCFGDFGQQGYGYQVDVLLRELALVLNLGKRFAICVVGVGNIGKALLRYYSEGREGFYVTSAFDVDPAVIDRTYGGVTVRDTEELPAHLAEGTTDIVAICTQRDQAEPVLRIAEAHNVKGVWNFAPVDLSWGAAFIENAQLTDDLLVLAYRMGR